MKTNRYDAVHGHPDPDRRPGRRAPRTFRNSGKRTFRDGESFYGFLPGTVPTARGAAADRPVLLLDRLGGRGQPARRGPLATPTTGRRTGASATPPTAETYIWSLAGILSLFVVLGLFIFWVHYYGLWYGPAKGVPLAEKLIDLPLTSSQLKAAKYLPGGDPAVPGADHLRRAAGPLHGPPGHLLSPGRRQAHPLQLGQVAGTCSSPSSGSPPPGWPRPSTWRPSSAAREPKRQGLLVQLLFAAILLVAVGSLAGEVAGIKGLLGELVVLVRPPGLGVPGAGTPLADPAVGRPDRLAADRLPGGRAGTCSRSSGGDFSALVSFYVFSADPGGGLLRLRPVLRPRHPT